LVARNKRISKERQIGSPAASFFFLKSQVTSNASYKQCKLQGTQVTRNASYKKRKLQETQVTRNTSYKKRKLQETQVTRNASYEQRNCRENSAEIFTLKNRGDNCSFSRQQFKNGFQYNLRRKVRGKSLFAEKIVQEIDP
jgi:hypothetical protein